MNPPTNLNEYYTSKGQALPSISDRAQIFQQNGLGDASTYVGSAQQNTALLGKLAAPPASPTSNGIQNAASSIVKTYSAPTQPTPTPPPQAPPVTQIANPATPPVQTGAGFTPPPATAPAVADNFNASLATTLKTQQDQLQQSLQQQQQQYQTKIDALNQQNSDYKQLEEAGLANENSAVAQETQQKQAALDQEQQQFNDNYNARQSLVGQLQTLLTTGQNAIQQLQNTSGMSSIMNAKISETTANVQAQAGVITAALSAYDSQIGLAQSQLKTATDAITSIYSDQLSYWQNIVSFYNGQQKDIEGQVASLSKEQQTYVDAQIKMLQDKTANTQSAMDSIQKAMLDPKAALAYAQAGVSLNDSPAQINQKLATLSYAQQLAGKTPSLGATNNTSDPVVQSWVENVTNGNATMQQVPANLRNAVSQALTNQPTDSYSPLASSRLTVAANRIVNNFVQLPQYQLTANGLPYLQRIQAAMQNPGSVSDQDLLDSLTKLNTAGNAISDAQVRLITDGKSFADMAATIGNKFKNGGVLSNNQRQQIQSIAQAIFANYQKGYQPVYDQATSQLKAAGIPEAFWTIPNLNNLSGQSFGGGSTPTTSKLPQNVQTALAQNGKLQADGKTILVPRAVWSTFGSNMDTVLSEAKAEGYDIKIN